MEEAKKSDEANNGDQVLLQNVKQAEATSEAVTNESTISLPEGGKPESDSDTHMEEKPCDPISSTVATNPTETADPSKVTVDEQTASAVVAETAPARVELNELTEPCAEVNKAASSVPEAKETTEKSATLEEVPNEEESAASKESESTNANMEESPTIEQAMEVEEPAVPVPVATVSIQEQIAQEQQLETAAVQNITGNSLSLLCQYSGSSDSEAEETDTSKADDAKKRAHSSSSSSSDDSSDVELVKDAPISAGYRVRDDPILVSDAETMDTNAASSEDEEDDLARGPIRTAGEILPHELPPIEELTISVPETECKPIGHVESIVAQIVLVQSVVGAELLNLETVLFLERGKRALGKIFDVIGQVNRPIYCVLFNSNQEVLSKNITVGMEVYCAPRTEYTSFIILSDLMRLKGSDASWMNDNEVPAYLAEHSDDEAERAAKKNRKKGAANRQHNQNDEQSSEQGGPEPQQHFHPRQQHPSTSRQQHYQQQYQRPPSNSGRQFNPRYPSGNSWHHNYQNPRYQNPHQYRPRFPPRNQQYQQQMPHMQPPPQGGLYLPNPFAGQGPPRPPSAGPN